MEFSCIFFTSISGYYNSVYLFTTTTLLSRIHRSCAHTLITWWSYFRASVQLKGISHSTSAKSRDEQLLRCQGQHTSITCITPTQRKFLPNPMSVPVTHIISDTSEASERAAVGTFPYLIWKGSIMVTYLLFLIGSAKNRPPQWWNKEIERFQRTGWIH